MVFIWIIPRALLIGVGVACLLWLQRGRKFAGTEPRCAACGYIVHGLPLPTCPECGGNLAQPGAVVTTGRLPPGRIARFIGWSIFCLLTVVIPVAYLWVTFGMPLMPEVTDNSERVTLYAPASKGFRSIAVLSHTHGWVFPHGRNRPPADLKIELTRSDGTVRGLAIDPATLRFRDASAPPSAMSSTPLNAEALLGWLKSVAVQGETNELRNEMSIAMTQVQQSVSQPATINTSTGTSGGFSGTGSSTTGTWGPLFPRLGDWAPLLIGAVVWAIGLIRILRNPSKARGDSHMIA